jgi:competence protein ComEC
MPAVVIAGILVAAAGAIVARVHRTRPGAPATTAVASALLPALCAGVLLGGAVRSWLTVAEAREYLPVSPAAVRSAEGRVRGSARLTEGGWAAELAVDRVRTAGGHYEARLRLPVYGLPERPSGGDRVRVSGELRRGERGLYLSASSADRLPNGQGDGAATAPLRAVAGATRARVETAVSRLGPASWLTAALLLGRTDGAPPYARELFRASGTAHILALSGMHLGILIALAMTLAAPVVGRHRALVLSLALVGGYVALVGFRASLARAAVMFGLGVCAVSTGRRPEPTRILAAAFLVLAVGAPRAVDGLSFQLSFAALGGILVFGRRLERAMVPWLPTVLRAPLAASIGAQLGTLPLVAAAFGVARPVGILATLAMAPIAVLFIWLSVAGVLLSVMAGTAATSGLLADTLRWVLAALESIILGLGDFFARAPGVWMGESAAVAAGAAVVSLAALLALLDRAPAEAHRGGGGDPDGVWRPLAADGKTA